MMLGQEWSSFRQLLYFGPAKLKLFSTLSSVRPHTVGVVQAPKNMWLTGFLRLFLKSSEREKGLLGNCVRCSTVPLRTCQWLFSLEDGGGLPVAYKKTRPCTNGKNNLFLRSITYVLESKILVSLRWLLGLGNPPKNSKIFSLGDEKRLSPDPDSGQPLEVQLHIFRKMFRINALMAWSNHKKRRDAAWFGSLGNRSFQISI